tara:strand:- start:159 stop:896 length:738 start_codon:yes stop_codon:yes gene_type:complete
MALIINARPKSNIHDSGYFRLCSNELIASLLQACHATVISNGTELEKFIRKYSIYKIVEKKEKMKKDGTPYASPQYVKGTEPTFDTVIEYYNNNKNAYFPKIRISRECLEQVGIKLSSKKNIELDGVWVKDGKIYVTEIKEGASLDTKKSDGEIKMFKLLSELFNYYNVNPDFFIVLWNLNDINDASIKSIEAVDYIITGADFSEIVKLDFIKLNKERQSDASINEKYIIEEMREIVKEYDETNS